jgi:hypothetical protein
MASSISGEPEVNSVERDVSSIETEELPSASAPVSPLRVSEGGKQRRHPSITPRKFNRFFTPRSLRSSQINLSRQALQDITGRPAGNPIGNHSSPLPEPETISKQENASATFPRHLKRRKLYHTPESSPAEVDDSKQKDFGYMTQHVDLTEASEGNIQSSPCGRMQSVEYSGEEEHQEPLKPIKQMSDRGLTAQLLQMNIGSSTRTSHWDYTYPVNGMIPP